MLKYKQSKNEIIVRKKRRGVNKRGRTPIMWPPSFTLDANLTEGVLFYTTYGKEFAALISSFTKL